MPAAAALLAVVAALAGDARAAGDWAARCRSEAAQGRATACEKALQTDPGDPALHALLGEAYFADGSYAQGLLSMRRAIDMSGGAPAYRLRFAGFAALVNEYADAAEELKQVVAVQPRNAHAWALLAVCLRILKDDAEALQASRRAAALGDAAEAYAMAGRYGSGDGVPRDAREERNWLRRAAHGGYIAAMQDLTTLYANGRPGIPPDPAKQHYWEEALRRAVN
jgi:cytochrome c-type biogenesis protein CcmH/NrfG